MHSENIILIGPMGAGKTTLGKILAKKYQLDFVDCDKEIEDLAGAKIPLIFEYEGESGFRKRETYVLEQLCNKKGLLIATGGGAVLKEENKKIMRSKGIIVFLNATVKTQYHRTKKDKNRPLLKDGNPKEKLAELYKVRLPVYQELADITINANRNSIRTVIEDIQNKLKAL
jgi:shikimate kinase